jgi:hypothetical protein
MTPAIYIAAILNLIAAGKTWPPYVSGAYVTLETQAGNQWADWRWAVNYN